MSEWNNLQKWCVQYAGDPNPDLKYIESYITRKNIKYRSPRGITAIHMAALGKSNTLIELLVKRGADINAKNHDGATPLHFAAREGGVDMLKQLLQDGANISETDNQNYTVIHWAVEAGNIEAVKLLLNKDASLIDIVTCFGQTALELAFEENELEIISLLVTRGAAVGKLLFDCIAQNNHELVTRLLPGKGIIQHDDNKRNPLHFAILLNQVDIAEILSKQFPHWQNEKDNEGNFPINFAKNEIQENITPLFGSCDSLLFNKK